jgi:TctA family transporter
MTSGFVLRCSGPASQGRRPALHLRSNSPRSIIWYIMVLAIVLGGKAEEAFRQSLLGSQGKLGVFWANPLVASIMALGLIALFWPMIQSGLAWIRRAPRATA